MPFQLKPKAQPMSSMYQRKGRKGSSKKIFIALGTIVAFMLLAAAASGIQHLTASHAASEPDSYYYKHAITTINGLKKIAQVGSTTNVLDARGKKATVDPNPYKIAIAPANLSYGIKAGDILVSNIGNEDHGATVIKFAGQKGLKQVGQVFNKMNDGVLGPAGVVFDKGKLLVANSTGNSVLVFNANGTLFATIKSALFNGPWGITVAGSSYSHNGMLSFFTANKMDAKILRVDVVLQRDGSWKFNVVQIGQFKLAVDMTKIDLHWLPALKIGYTTWRDVLLAVDPANNRIAAFAKSSVIKGMGKGTTVFAGKPLNMPGGLGINPLNGDLLVVNLMDNNLVELNPTNGKLVGVKQIDPVKVNNQGDGSALFGVVGTKDKAGNLKVFFTDDNTNTLNVLSAS
jgi:DNA-binding beta-propeller fold protein YncE